jgi:hypothetical protein
VNLAWFQGRNGGARRGTRVVELRRGHRHRVLSELTAVFLPIAIAFGFFESAMPVLGPLVVEGLPDIGLESSG